MSRYERGDYVKVQFDGDGTLPEEWMWILVDRCDEVSRLVFGRLDNEPIINSQLPLRKELAISYDQIREHRKSWEFHKN